jgi:hypothetical protein
MKTEASFIKPFKFYIKINNNVYLEEVKINNCSHYKNVITGKTYLFVSDSDINKIVNSYAGDFLETKSHLCWQECKNCSPSKCTKIFDSEKKNISEYPYIEEGFQVTDSEGGIRRFFVSKCKNYEPIIKKAKILKQRSKYE